MQVILHAGVRSWRLGHSSLADGCPFPAFQAEHVLKAGGELSPERQKSASPGWSVVAVGHGDIPSSATLWEDPAGAVSIYVASEHLVRTSGGGCD